MNESRPRIGFTCAYAPIPLIAAAGFVPYRVLPVGDAPEQAGILLHDNVCPHVKRILDRVIAGDLPELAGVVVMESCDTMRRLADAWRVARPGDRLVSVDLPTTDDPAAVSYFTTVLRGLTATLEQWGGVPVTDETLRVSIGRYNELTTVFAALGGRVPWRTLQEGFNLAVSEPITTTLGWARTVARTETPDTNGVPVLLIGNVLPDPAAFDLLEQSGVRLVGNELCTGDRQLTAVPLVASEAPLMQLAAALLSRPVCARTLAADTTQRLAAQTAHRARASGARGVIAHVMKFCDPYLARLPAVRDALRAEGIPLLVLEGDCSLGSVGQQRTRIEAFVEMLA